MCSDDWGDSGEECARTIRETVEKNVVLLIDGFNDASLD